MKIHSIFIHVIMTLAGKMKTMNKMIIELFHLNDHDESTSQIWLPNYQQNGLIYSIWIDDDDDDEFDITSMVTECSK